MSANDSQAIKLPLGSVMIDVAGYALSNEERQRLCHPSVGAVILFARNFQSRAQLQALTAEIRGLRQPALLIAVDHEGGRVQRFRDGYTRLPAMARLGELWRENPEFANCCSESIGYILSRELLRDGIDFSFAPVLDLDYGRSGVIGDRAFAASAEVVSMLAASLMAGMKAAGMASVGKHFPGHGYVEADSHHALPVDERRLRDIERDDLLPYRRLIPLGLDAVMPAHVVYSRIDPQAAGFSRLWLKRELRRKLRFDGVIFSDDLSMAGAHSAGTVVQRAQLALAAGCDMILLCNDPSSAQQLLDGLEAPLLKPRHVRRMRGRPLTATLERDGRYRAARENLARLEALVGATPQRSGGVAVGEAEVPGKSGGAT